MSTSEKDSVHGADPKDNINIAEAEAQLASKSSGEVDDAWKYLDGHRDAAAVDAIDLTALRRRIDFRIVPLMFLCYTLQFLDKVILNVRTNHIYRNAHVHVACRKTHISILHWHSS